MRAGALAALCAALAACRGGRPEIRHACVFAASPDRRAVVWATDDALVLRRGAERRTIRFADHPCLRDGRDITLLALFPDGRAIVLGERATGGSIHHHVEHTTTVTCVVDFDAGTAADLATLGPDIGLATQIRHRSIRVGARSGRVYTWESTGTLAVLDVAGQRATTLDVDGGFGCDLVELGDGGGTLFACPDFEGESGAYTHYVRLVRLDTTVWPPRVEGERRLPAGNNISEAVFSRDGAYLAYYGAQLPSASEAFLLVARVSDALILFDRRLPAPEYVTAVEFAANPEDGLLVAEKVGDRGARLRRLGIDAAVLETRGLAEDAPYDLVWEAPDRVFLDYGCHAEVLQLGERAR